MPRRGCSAGAFDEAFDRTGSPRPPYAKALAALAEHDLRELERRMRLAVRGRGVVFGGAAGEREFALDPVPRVFEAAEWSELERGLAQRVRALDAFCADAHGERRAISAGVVPERVLEQTAFLEADLHEGGVRQEPWIAIAGLDVVRDPDGHLRVLEDNVRTPSGLAYALAARELVGAELGLAAADGADGADGAPLEIEARLRELLRRVLARRPPHDDGDGVTVLLTDGERNSAFYEHRVLASLLGLALVGVADLRRRAGRLWLRADGRPVSVVYRRTDEERLREPGGRLTPFGELALEPLREGTLRVVNGFGTGVADDKLVYGCVERMIEFYLGEQPAIGSVATFDLGVREQREQALERLEELVLKPRDGHGGTGVLIGPRASRRELARARETLAREPERWLAQETVVLSTHPTLIDGELVPRHVDLRPFVFYDGREASVLAGGLTRVALREGSLIVNSSRSGGGKDTWVLA